MKFPYHLIELTHTLSEEIPTWSGSCGFTQTVILDYADCTTEPPFKVQSLSMVNGIGTHIDAPAHCVPGAATVDQLLLEQLVASCVVIDVSDKAHEHYSVSTEDIFHFEKAHGTIPEQSFVIIRTGWDRYWHNKELYHNNHRFPSVNLEAAQLLLDRKIVGLGIDTLSPDRPEDNFVVHALLLQAGIFIVENIAHSDKLPLTKSFIAILPLKIKDGTEAPVRLIGLIPT